MKTYLLEEILKATGAKMIIGGETKKFSRISIDSRDCRGGEIFFAIKGEKFDGNDFVLKALENGALGAVVSETNKIVRDLPLEGSVTILETRDTLTALQDLAAFYREKVNPKVIAITGSNGKTTTKEILHSILSKKASAIKTIGNFNNLIGLPLSLLNVDYGCRFAVIEMGMSVKGEIDRLCQVAMPSDAILTNVALSHSENFSDITEIAEEKALLARYVEEKKGKVLCNGDDKVLVQAVKKVCRNPILFGKGEECHIRMYDLENDLRGVSFSYKGLGKKGRIRLNLPGIHNAYNCLGAIAYSILEGFTENEIEKGVESAETLSGRMSVKELPCGITIIDDSYNANPNSFEKAIEYLSCLECRGRRIVLMGDMLELGKYTESSHRSIGKLCAQKGMDFLFTVGRESRLAANEAVRAGIPEKNVLSFDDASTAGEALSRLLNRDDILLVKGSRMMRLERAIEVLLRKIEEGSE
ncbi:MAG: UDP-N-acetylmuramoyl-tripeptide--D-alanyl-D-alanine ligase [Candidatus Schekmanbacteria bacterium]|nr:MAG: UDP-N-acetylmuramoyl-tripeptide--D-alanyl-D-alanine ligase [Candidatus Schekmanbacteria bacterium]